MGEMEKRLLLNMVKHHGLEEVLCQLQSIMVQGAREFSAPGMDMDCAKLFMFSAEAINVTVEAIRAA